jgi:hypothetical protein
MGTTKFIFITGLLLLSPFHATRTVAQSNKPAESGQIVDIDKTLRQMLAEVRELRIAVQRASTTQTRFQMLVERLRIQQTHVDTVNRRLDDLRSQSAAMRAEKPLVEQQVKDAEDILERTTDPNGRVDLESRIKSMKAIFARLGPEEERLRTRQLELESEIQIAQVRLTELNSQLDALLNEMKTP